MIVMSNNHRASEPNWEPTGLIFDEGPTAGEWVKAENSFLKEGCSVRRYKVVKISDDDPLAWRQRMKKALDEGVFKRPPWHGYYHEAGMYEHIDPDSPTLIRFIMSEEDGMANKFTRVSPARFILRYLDSCPSQRRMDEWCAQMGLDITVSKLKIARSPEEVVRVYNEGPHSCMAYELREGSPFQSLHVHPVACYGNSDLGVAYIVRREEISARCLVWPDKKIYGRIYGDTARLQERLKEEGYVEDWDAFNGAKIRHIKDPETGMLIVPYFDGDLGAIVQDENWLVISDKPSIILKSPHGVPETDACMYCNATGVWLERRTDPDDECEHIYVCAEGCEN